MFKSAETTFPSSITISALHFFPEGSQLPQQALLLPALPLGHFPEGRHQGVSAAKSQALQAWLYWELRHSCQNAEGMVSPHSWWLRAPPGNLFCCITSKPCHCWPLCTLSATGAAVTSSCLLRRKDMPFLPKEPALTFGN